MLTAQIETLASVLDDLKRYLPIHWEELALYKDRMPLAPRYDAYLALEASGELMFCTLRLDGELVGYFVAFVKPHMHYGTTLTCTMDILWIRPDLRRGGGGKLLLDAVKKEFARRGGGLWWVGSKKHQPIDQFFADYGFDPAETYHSMWVGGSNEA